VLRKYRHAVAGVIVERFLLSRRFWLTRLEPRCTVTVVETKTRRTHGLKGEVMFPAQLPFDYLQQLDRGDRIRRSRALSGGSRLRRGVRTLEKPGNRA